ncbi:hypothetical protein BBJ28_00027235 [Nothophytophthora sp. Chile5]|nr:hypothetical protein BBJ28_00027235 [Nothophytophthora sp. Chile5]
MADAARREACSRCRRPPRVCYCASLPAEPLTAELTHVLVLQHEHEQRRRAAISSVPVLSKVLTNLTIVVVDNDDCSCGPGESAELDALLYNVGDTCGFDAALLLFPDEHAQPLDAALLASLPRNNSNASSEPAACGADKRKRVLLVVIDGTWKEAKKIAHRNRTVWQQTAQRWEQRGAAFRYICLDSTTSHEEPAASERPCRSIYGELRREPMEGCLSTLEATAAALLVLEPRETGRQVHDALLHAFRGMVVIQEQFQQRGRAAKLEMYNGVSKQEAVGAKRLQLLRLEQQQESRPASQDTTALRQREYVFYTTLTDFRHRQQLTQQVQQA